MVISRVKKECFLVKNEEIGRGQRIFVGECELFPREENDHEVN